MDKWTFISFFLGGVALFVTGSRVKWPNLPRLGEFIMLLAILEILGTFVFWKWEFFASAGYHVAVAIVTLIILAWMMWGIFGVHNQSKLARKPRSLSADQASKIENFLLPREKDLITIVSDRDDAESKRFASDIFQAFRIGGWEVSWGFTSNGIFEGQRIKPGHTIRCQYPRNIQGTPKGVGILKDAFRRAGIGSNFEAFGGTSPDTVTKPNFFIFVGPKPKK